MWRFLKGVAKPEPKTKSKLREEDKEKKKKYDAVYDKAQRQRKTFEKWTQGRPWLTIDHVGVMICTLCTKHEVTLKQLGLLTSRNFIVGCQSHKAESITFHEKSRAHKKAEQLDLRTKHPEKAPATLAYKAINKAHMNKLRLLFRNTHALAKNRKSFRDYTWLCDLDEVKGLDPGMTYRNHNACRTFTQFIASTAKQKLSDAISDTDFISITSDGSTDSSRTEQEIVFVRFVQRGKVRTEFAGIVTPASPNAAGLYDSILKALKSVNISEDVLKDKLVGLGCDGASVMTGRIGGVAALFKRNLQPSLIMIHCLCHRLELALKDAVKSIKLYGSTLVLLMGVYYFYHNSPKQRQNLRNSFESLSKKPLMPTRVGGTRWVGHMFLAVETFLKGYEAIYNQMEDCINQKTKGESTNKARGYLRLMKRPNIIAYMHLLKDVLKPLKTLSATLQSNDTTLADVRDKLDTTKAVLRTYQLNNGPNLSKFLNDMEAQGDSLLSEKLSGKVDENQFAKTRTTLVTNIIDELEKRTADVSGDFISATEVANFRYWPLHGKPEVADFGDNKIKIICNQYSNILERAGFSTEDAVMEWTELKNSLYNRYKENVQKLTWPEVNSLYLEDHARVLSIMNLILTLPASSAENERGFSKMKLIKTDHRSKMSTDMLDNLMAIEMGTPRIKEFNPDAAIEAWMGASKTKRRPTFKDGRKPRSGTDCLEAAGTMEVENETVPEQMEIEDDTENQGVFFQDIDNESDKTDTYQDFDNDEDNELGEGEVDQLLETYLTETD